MGKGCPRACRPSQSSCHRSKLSVYQIWYLRWPSNQEGGPHTPHSSSERCLSWCESTAPKPPCSRASWCIGGSVGNPWIPTLSENLHSVPGSQEQTTIKERWTKHPDPRSCQPPAFKIRSYPLAHVYSKNLNDKRTNIAYLSLLCLSKRMILQPTLKVSVSDTTIYSSSKSISSGLAWWEHGLKLRLWAPKSNKTSSQEKTASMSMRTTLAHVFPLEALLHKAGLRHEEAPQEIVRDSEETLAVSTEHRLLDRVSIRISLMSLVSSPSQPKWLCRT